MSLSLDPLLGKDEQLLELYKAREDAQHALEHENFSVAESKFKLAMELERALGIEETQGEARTGLIETRYRAGLHAEEALRHLREARNYYRDVLDLDPDHSQARAHLDAVTRKMTVQRVIIFAAIFIILVIAALLLIPRVPKPVEVCAISGNVLCTPTPTFTLTPTATLTPTPTSTATPTPTPTPTPYLLINVINPQDTPVTVREIGRIEDDQNTSVCEDCRQANTAFADAAVQVGAYIELYEEQIILDEDSLPVPDEHSKPIPDYDKSTSPHYVQWPRWDTGEHSANFVVATVTPTPTPMPVTVMGTAPNPNVFDKPGGTLQFYLQRGVCVYVCDEADEFYQVANDYCHLTTPIGWVPKKHLSAPSIGGCPAVTPESVPTIAPTATPTPGG